MKYDTKQQSQKRSEKTEQETVIQWCGWQQGKYPELKLIYHVPNGGSRNTVEAANLKRQGVKAGVPDLCLPVPKNGYHGLYIEMKYGKNKTTEKQEEWLKELTVQGYFTAVCYGAEEAKRVIARYLAFPGYPKIERKAIPMVDYIGYTVPEDLCMINQEGTIKGFVGCGYCLDYDGEADCESCIITKIFEEYAKLTGQKRVDELSEYEKKKEVTVAELIEILKGLNQKAIVISGNERNIKIYPGKENKEGGRNIVLLC